MTRIILLLLLLPAGILYQGAYGGSADTCSAPYGYIRLNATNFIKAVKNSDSFDNHLGKVQAKAASLGGNVKGRLAILDNQTKDDTAQDLMRAKAVHQAWIGMKCLTSDPDENCTKISNWNWTENGVTKYQPVVWKPAMKTDDGNNEKCMRIWLYANTKWNNQKCEELKGAIYELIMGDCAERTTQEPQGLTCNQPSDGYTRLNATNFIKAMPMNTGLRYQSNHLTAVKNEAAVLGNNVKGRLAVLDNQTKDELAQALMVAGNVEKAWIGMTCFQGNCEIVSKWGWTEGGGIKLQEIEWHPNYFVPEYSSSFRFECVLIQLQNASDPAWENWGCSDKYAGGIYELILEGDPCLGNTCKDDEVCVSCFGNYICEPHIGDTCTTSPSGYKRLNATNFIKAVSDENDVGGHLEMVQKEASDFGENVKGRLAILDNQTKDELAQTLMQDTAVNQAWIGMKCLTLHAGGDCTNVDNWIWTEDGVTKYQPVVWKPKTVTTNSNNGNPTMCMRIRLDSPPIWNDKRCDELMGAIYELIVTGKGDCAKGTMGITEETTDINEETTGISEGTTDIGEGTTDTTERTTDTSTSIPLTCADKPCPNGRVCNENSNGKGYTCNCSIGFFGKNCEYKTTQVEPDLNFRPCPDNPEGFEYRDHCYWIQSIPKDAEFSEAKLECEKHDGILATPMHLIIQRFFFNKMNGGIDKKKLWIGLQQTGNKNGKVDDGWEVFDPYFGHSVNIDSAFIPWQIGRPFDSGDYVEDGDSDNAIMDSGGYFRDKRANKTLRAVACQRKLYLTEYFMPVAFGEKIAYPITKEFNAYSIGKCARECYQSWACNSISYGPSNQCFFHLFGKDDHENVTTEKADGFQILQRIP